MPNIAVRVEATGGTHTNTASETSRIFDVKVVAGLFEGDLQDRTEGGRPVIVTNGKGAVLNLRAYAHSLNGAPEDYEIEDMGIEGMYADNPTTEESLPTQVEGLVTANSQTKIATFIGQEALDAGLNHLGTIPGSKARYLAGAIAIAAANVDRQISS